LPVLLLVTTDLIKKSFRPVLNLAAGVYRRDERDLTPLRDDNIPDEIRPFVESINRLLHKVNNTIQAQKRFIADAAHELRTPLTALSLQAERLSGSDMSAEARERLAALRLGLTRE
ncbi:histidine kinase dimerization/phospho-acceptor domain-containing protein, partial [Enterobacter asburiae]